MHLKDLDNDIAKALNLSKKEVRPILFELETQIRDKILYGQEIQIREIGKLELKISKARTRFNIHSKEYIDCPAKYRLAFKVSRTLDQSLAKKTVYDGQEEKN